MGTPTFPGVVEEVVGAMTAPKCTICHATTAGGQGTVTRPFGIYLRARGLVPNDEGSLRTALAAADAEHHDSDGDGVPDIAALRAGHDPNGESPAMSGPEYGCAAATSSHPEGISALAALLLVLAWRSRSRPPERST